MYIDYPMGSGFCETWPSDFTWLASVLAMLIILVTEPRPGGGAASGSERGGCQRQHLHNQGARHRDTSAGSEKKHHETPLSSWI